MLATSSAQIIKYAMLWQNFLIDFVFFELFLSISLFYYSIWLIFFSWQRNQPDMERHMRIRRREPRFGSDSFFNSRRGYFWGSKFHWTSDVSTEMFTHRISQRNIDQRLLWRIGIIFTSRAYNYYAESLTFFALTRRMQQTRKTEKNTP